MDFTSVLINEQNKKKAFGKRAKTAITVALLAPSLVFLFQLNFSLFTGVIASYYPAIFESTLSFAVDIVGYLFYIGIPYLIIKLIYQRVNKNVEYNVVRRSSPKAPALYIFGAVGVGYLINFTINILFGSIIEKYSADLGIQANGALEIILCFVLYAILPALLEEWAFRGILCKNLLPYGKGGAIIISSIIFGIAHVDPPRIIFATAFGMILAVCYEYTGSLKIPMLIHFINNAISVTASLFPEDSPLMILISQVILGIMGCGIAAIIYYANKGIERKKISITKPRAIGFKLSISEMLKRAGLNFALIPLVILYAIFFTLYFIV